MKQNKLKKIAIIGSGVYGSYIARRLTDQSDLSLTIFEIGNKKISTDTNLNIPSKIINEEYSGTSKGRFFGLGGTSSKWGGKILFFDKNSFNSAGTFLSQLVDLNVKYSKLVKSIIKIKSKQNNSIKLNNSSYRLEYGDWLFPFRKNFFKIFGINNLKNINLLENSKVIKLVNKDSGANVIYQQDGKLKNNDFDFIFLCSGAFECARILVQSKLENPKLNFSDHVGIQFGKSKGPMYFFGHDFSYKFSKFSLRTSRLSSEFKRRSFYIHPIIDMNRGFLMILKKILKEDFKISDILSFFKFIFIDIYWLFKCFIYRKLLPRNNTWRLNMTIENNDSRNFVNFKKSKDDSLIMEIDYQVGDNLKKDINEIINNLKLDLNDCNINFFNTSKFSNYEDVYHPFGLFEFDNLRHFKNKYGKIICFSTAILPRSGSINPTGAILPVIEYILNEKPWND